MVALALHLEALPPGDKGGTDVLHQHSAPRPWAAKGALLRHLLLQQPGERVNGEGEHGSAEVTARREEGCEEVKKEI